MSKAIGFILTITGAVLGVWFAQMLAVPGPAPLPNFVVAAISLAMVSVGIRYIIKGSKKKPKKKEGQKER
ncbi:MAG: hypothetical protein Q8R02_22805 [Hyphomonadaceae bacterium]|nr:hypothetical protein [Hyphomonadaceae bacterium]